MKKRMFICSFIFTMLVLGILISNEAFGQSVQLPAGLEEYEQTLRHKDVRSSLPDFLETFKKSGIQKDMSPRYIDSFLRNPIFLRKLVPGTDPQFIGLLYADEPFRTLFGDEQFYNVLKDSNEIDKFLKWFEKLPEDGPICEIPEPEPPKATTLSIVSGFGQEGSPGGRLSRPFVVEVRDQYGEAFPRVNVSFHITKGGGGVSPTAERTNNRGQASTILTLGDTSGTTWVEARVSGITQAQTFTATAVAPREDREGDESEEEPPLPPMYWIEGNTIYYRPTGGGKTVFNAPQNGDLTGGLAVDTVGRKVYWTEQTGTNTGRIQSANLDGTRVQPVKEILAVPSNITVGTDKSGKRWIYWTNSNKKIQRIKINNSGIVDRASFEGDFKVNLDSPKHIAFDAEWKYLYWTEPGRIKSVYPNGQWKNLVAENLGELGGIAVANGVVYWTEQTNGFGEVRSIKDTGKDNKLLAVTDSMPEGIAVDPEGKRVYWTTSAGGIQSAPLTGAIRTDVKSEMNGAVPATGIALGGTAVAPANTAASAPSVSSVNPGVSVENTLLANYPNPFNPETWIPYQLSASADVSVSIYSVNGHLVRHLDLGHQSAGVYRSRSRAAYWDGRNAFGERVASGLYFYTLTAGDFTATRKMLIRK